ncbi:MAG: hypothetical protein QXO51_00735 [Halobacteria archaeon]
MPRKRPALPGAGPDLPLLHALSLTLIIALLPTFLVVARGFG